MIMLLVSNPLVGSSRIANLGSPINAAIKEIEYIVLYFTIIAQIIAPIKFPRAPANETIQFPSL